MSDSEKIASKKESNNFTGITGISLEKEMKNSSKDLDKVKEDLKAFKKEICGSDPNSKKCKLFTIYL